MANVAEDIKAVLEFYEALGFERLPITIAQKGRKAEEGQSITGSKHHRIQDSEALILGCSDTDTPSSLSSFQTSEQKRVALKKLREEIGDCQRCKLSKGRKNIVFGEGNVDARIMFIGEGPGEDEDIQGRPFIGKAGVLLTSLITKMGFKREDVYIGNIVKCRPPFNRDPEDDEINTCLPFVKKQAEVICPKVIVSLGRISAQTLVGSKIPISRLRGHFYQHDNIPLMPTFHPAYLLRNPKDKWLVWEDVQKVLERLK